MDRGAWCTTVHGFTKSWTQLSDFHSLLYKDRVTKDAGNHKSTEWKSVEWDEDGEERDAEVRDRQQEVIQGM